MTKPARKTRRPRAPSRPARGALDEARAHFVDVVGTEISAIWRNVTRLGGQCVAALYLHAAPRSMDDLSDELGRSKSNVFSNLRALEQLGIVRRVRVAGSAKDHFELAGEYPDVLVLAFARHLSATLRDKSTELSQLASGLSALDRERGAVAVADRIRRMAHTYAAAGALIEGLLPPVGEPGRLAGMLGRITPKLLRAALRTLGR